MIKNRFFNNPDRKLTYEKYCASLLRRAKESGSGQFEMALIGFADFENLKKLIATDYDYQVDFSAVSNEVEYSAAFDWLERAVLSEDEEAINYFQTRLQEHEFCKAYCLYIRHCRPDSSLVDYVDKPPGYKK